MKRAAAIGLLVGALLAVPAYAGEVRVVPRVGLWVLVLDTVQDAWTALLSVVQAAPECGVGLDPDGRCQPASVNADCGSAIDPFGGCRPASVQADCGASIDPTGGCRP